MKALICKSVFLVFETLPTFTDMLIATGFGKMKFPVFLKGFDTTENIHYDPHLKTEL